MTTSTLQQRPSGVIRASPTILKRPRYHEVRKTSTKPVLLRNLRNYYARRRPSMTISNKAPPEEPPTDRKVQFFPKVRVKRIPNRLSYTDETRASMWLPKKELKQMVMKNHAEFAFEGQDWQNAPEETNGFGLRNGELVHPFYVWAEQEEANSSSDGSAMEDDSSESDAEEETVEE